jgi:tetratricopeptide (TPR) repeat protein
MTGRLSREMEFDFVEGQGGGTFVATGKVRAVILAHLNHGEVEKAASLIATSAPELGDALLEEDARDASAAAREALAEAFVRARDFDRAGRAALMIGDPGRAAPFFERSYQFARAAQLYEQAGKLDRVAELYERDLRFDLAARFYERSGQNERAAVAHEKAGQFFDAGRQWGKVRRLDRAVETLQRVEPTDKSFAPAVLLLGRILEHAGHRQAAAAHYIRAVRACPLDASSVEIYERLAEIYVAVGERQAAQKLAESALRFDPKRERPARLLASLGLKPGDPVPAAPPTQRSSTYPAEPASTSVAVKPLVLPPAPGQDPAAGTSDGAVTAVNEDVDVLRQLPLLGELSLDELRALQAFGGRKSFPTGTVMIEQGRDGEQMLVVLSGKVRISHLDDAGRVTVLGDLGYGASLGEMALVDDGPTSARVEAIADVVAFAWPLDRLRRHLATHEGTALRVLRVISRTLSVRLRETNRLVAKG